MSVFTVDQFFPIIQTHYPTITEKNIQIFNDGWDYQVYVVDGTYAFRFPRTESYARRLAREVTFLGMFSPQSPVRVPQLTLHQYEKKPYVTYDFIKGVAGKPTLLATFSPSEQQNIAHAIGNFLTTLHSFPLTKARTLGIYELDCVVFWTKRLEKIKASVFPHITTREQQWILNLFTPFLTIIKQQPIQVTLTHSDIMPEHIIVNPTSHTLSGIIDFGDMSIGDPVFDFTSLQKYGQQFLEDVYSNYHLPTDATFEKRRQFYEHRLVISNVEHSLTLHDDKLINLHLQQLATYIKTH